ncbi:MAG: response regulator transcription factor [Flavobacteriales bacterium]|nr:response regulator transcription factor [Flavobacteriales bacterium]MBP9078763.1 response regulator transcription factor [Flavobacteriales bacterium]
MEKKTRLLLCEDDPNLGMLLAQYLLAKGYEVELLKDGQAGWEAYTKGGFDLLLLDIMMPVMDGITLAREIRKQDDQTPIIFLTAKNMRQDALAGFESGADDYLTKPFSMEELLFRIHAVLRRSWGATEPKDRPTRFNLGLFSFDARKQLLTGPGGERNLTTKENELLHLLCEHANALLDRPAALHAVWGDDNYFNGRSMDVYIAKLRKYLADDPQVEIVNVHGKGFRLVVPER